MMVRDIIIENYSLLNLMRIWTNCMRKRLEEEAKCMYNGFPGMGCLTVVYLGRGRGYWWAWRAQSRIHTQGSYHYSPWSKRDFHADKNVFDRYNSVAWNRRQRWRWFTKAPVSICEMSTIPKEKPLDSDLLTKKLDQHHPVYSSFLSSWNRGNNLNFSISFSRTSFDKYTEMIWKNCSKTQRVVQYPDRIDCAWKINTDDI